LTSKDWWKGLPVPAKPVGRLVGGSVGGFSRPREAGRRAGRRAGNFFADRDRDVIVKAPLSLKVS